MKTIKNKIFISIFSFLIIGNLYSQDITNDAVSNSQINFPKYKGKEFEIINYYDSIALIHDKKLEEKKLFSRVSQSCSDVNSIEKNVLINLYSQLTNQGWSGYWDVNQPVHTWNGVIVTEDGCHVESLYLLFPNSINLVLPDLSPLSYLTALDLGSNGSSSQTNYHITGNFTSIGQLTELKTMIIYNANFNSQVPISFQGLTKLENLRLVNCNLNDNSQFCSVFSNLHNLVELMLDFNNYSGNLSSCINGTNLPKLEVFTMMVNQLTNINSLETITTLRVIWMGNNLINQFPNVNSMTNLEQLLLRVNLISSSIPNHFFNKQKIVYLDFSYNSLEGIVPFVNFDVANTLPFFSIRHNKFRFVDFVNNFSYFKNNFNFEYSPQDFIDDYYTLTVNEGDLVTFKMFEDDNYDSQDTFQWYKGNIYNSFQEVSTEITGNNSFSFIASAYSSGSYFGVSRHHIPEITTSNIFIQYPGGGYYNNKDLSLVRRYININVIPAPCYNCTSFDLLKDEKYLVSAWVKEEYENDPNRQFKYYENSAVKIDFRDINGNFLITPFQFFPSGEIIDGWQRIVGEFVVPTDVDDIHIELLNLSQDGKVTYFDDVRVLPSKGNMKSFVYDQKTQRLMAELDENNYSTFYEYDLEGGLIRVKKETERGVFTIQETRSGNTKK